MTTECHLTREIYTETATIKTAEAFKDLCEVHVLPANDGILITVEITEGGADVLDEFLNYVLALSAQEMLS